MHNPEKNKWSIDKAEYITIHMFLKSWMFLLELADSRHVLQRLCIYVTHIWCKLHVERLSDTANHEYLHVLFMYTA